MDTGYIGTSCVAFDSQIFWRKAKGDVKMKREEVDRKRRRTLSPTRERKEKEEVEEEEEIIDSKDRKRITMWLKTYKLEEAYEMLNVSDKQPTLNVETIFSDRFIPIDVASFRTGIKLSTEDCQHRRFAYNDRNFVVSFKVLAEQNLFQVQITPYTPEKNRMLINLKVRVTDKNRSSCDSKHVYYEVEAGKTNVIRFEMAIEGMAGNLTVDLGVCGAGEILQ